MWLSLMLSLMLLLTRMVLMTQIWETIQQAREMGIVVVLKDRDHL
jgi:hypothetical protein